MNPNVIARRLSTGLLGLLFFGILTLWIPGFRPTAVFRVGIFALALAWCFLFAVRGVPVRLTPGALPLAGAALWPLAQLAANSSVYRWETSGSLWTWLVNFLVFLLAAQIAADPAELRRFLHAVVHFAAGLAAVATIQVFTSRGKVFWIFPTGYEDFVLGPFVYRNQYAAFVELVLPIALSFSLTSAKNRFAYSLMAAVMAGSVIASSSRAGTVIVALELLIVPLLAATVSLSSWRNTGAALAKTAALVAAAALVVGYEAAWQRFLQPDPYFLRREVSLSALHMVKDRPGMGFGLGTWAAAYPRYAVFDPDAVINQAHNDWLQWAVEGGLPFLVLMLVFACLLLRPAARSVWGIGVIAVMLHAFVDYPMQQRPALAALFFALAGVLPAGRWTIAGIAARSGHSDAKQIRRSFADGLEMQLSWPYTLHSRTPQGVREVKS